MKAKKFFKRFLKIRYIVALLLIICVVIVACVYFVGGMKYQILAHDTNIPFTYEGFKDFTSYHNESDQEDNWYDNAEYTGNPLTFESAKVVAKNNQYTLFFDEKTTIATVAVNNTLESGKDPNDPNSYKTTYSTGKISASDLSAAANISVQYVDNRTGKEHTGEFLDSYSKSVYYENTLTGSIEKHYGIKYLTSSKDGYDGVQILYSIGNFSAGKDYFPQEMYYTVYKPSKYSFTKDGVFDENGWEEAVSSWENNYLPLVGGDLFNTFEERFRGNVEIEATCRGPEYKVTYLGTANVYSEEARDYLMEVVLPDLYEKGEVDFSPEEFPEEYISNISALSTNNSYKPNDSNYKEYYWKFQNLPQSLVDPLGEYYKEYFNNEDSPLTNNPFLYLSAYNDLKGLYSNKLADDNHPYNFLSYIGSGAPQNSKAYTLLYKNGVVYGGGSYYQVPGSKPVERLDGQEFGFGGFVARDDEGNFIYDEEGRVTPQVYTLALTNLDNDLMGCEASTELAVFNIAIEFKINENGLVMSVLSDSVRDGSNATKDDPNYNSIKGDYYLSKYCILENMTSIPANTEPGEIIVPDGCGAVIEFDNQKYTQNYPAYNNYYYGGDQVNIDNKISEDKGTLYLGMYGFLITASDHPRGVLAVIDKGGFSTKLSAGSLSKENYAYFSVDVRSNETIKVGSSKWATDYTKWSKKLPGEDFQYSYVFLNPNEVSYVGLANRYRQYLMDRDGLQEKDTTTSTVLDLNLLGSYDRYSMTLGIKYKTAGALTTFSQAKDIIEELKENKVQNFSVTYTGWTNERLEYEVGGSIKVASILGKAMSMRKFFEYCSENAITFYPEMFVTTTTGYDMSFGSSKYSARSASNAVSCLYEFNPATERQDKKLSREYRLSPRYYQTIAQKINKSFKKLKIWQSSTNQYGGYYLSDLGNFSIGNYKNGQEIYGEEAKLYQQSAMDVLSENNNIKISAPYDYAFKYINFASEVPYSASKWGMFDYEIPFYQLVVSGLFDYCSNPLNENSDLIFIKSLAQGANLGALLSANDPSELLDTDYTYYFDVHYQNHKDEIIRCVQEMDALGIHQGRLTYYENVTKDICYVEYTKKDGTKIKLRINTTNKDAEYGDHLVMGPYSYEIVE